MLRTRWIGTGIQGTPYYLNNFFGGTTELEAQAAINAVQEFLTQLGPIFSTSLIWRNDTDVPVVDPATGNTLETFSVTAESQAGGNATAVLPYATQGLIRWRTGQFQNRREIRGRTFLPGMAENQSDIGRPITGAITAMENAINAMLTNGTGAGGLVIYSRVSLQPATVTSGSPWSDWAQLRSRRD